MTDFELLLSIGIPSLLLSIGIPSLLLIIGFLNNRTWFERIESRRGSIESVLRQK